MQNKANLHFTAETTENLATKTQRREDKKKTYIINLGVLAPLWLCSFVPQCLCGYELIMKNKANQSQFQTRFNWFAKTR